MSYQSSMWKVYPSHPSCEAKKPIRLVYLIKTVFRIHYPADSSGAEQSYKIWGDVTSFSLKSLHIRTSLWILIVCRSFDRRQWPIIRSIRVLIPNLLSVTVSAVLIRSPSCNINDVSHRWANQLNCQFHMGLRGPTLLISRAGPIPQTVFGIPLLPV